MEKDKIIINPDFENWVNNNRELLRKYKGNWVAITEELGVVASKKTLHETEEEALKKTSFRIVFYYVNPYIYSGFRFLPIHFNTVKIHTWQPVKSIKLKGVNKEIEMDMLVDSGADCSLISLDTGLKLGLSLSPLEDTLEARGIGGNVEYVMRKLELTIDDYSLQVPVAWVQNSECVDEIIGRLIVFDFFNIEFRQSEEKIIFTPVNGI